MPVALQYSQLRQSASCMQVGGEAGPQDAVLVPRSELAVQFPSPNQRRTVDHEQEIATNPIMIGSGPASTSACADWGRAVC